MDMAFPHVAERLFGRAHPIEPAAFRAIVESPLGRRVLTGLPIDGGKRKDKAGRVKTARDVRREQMSALYDGQWVKGDGNGVEYFLNGDGVAIVPVVGILSARFDWLAALCGWTTYEGLSCTFDEIGADGRVRGVLMDVESPGGEAAGMLDVADKIIAARSTKPIWAVANAYAFSAAYAVAGSAGRLIVPRLCQVGSIGAVCVHIDQSEADEQMGLKYTAIYSGARKIDGWPHAPLSDDARASMQGRIDYCRDQFAALVGRQGRMTAAAAMKTEAEVYHDQPAVDAKLADAVGSFDEALRELSDLAAGRPRSAATAAETQAVIDQGASPMASDMADDKKPGQEQAEHENPIEQSAATVNSSSATPPAVSAKQHKCGKCGHEWDDEDDKEKAALAVSPLSADAAAVLELCATQGVSAAQARAYIIDKTPIAQVRSQIAADKANAADRTVVDATKSPAVNESAGLWESAAASVNKLFGIAPKS